MHWAQGLAGQADKTHSIYLPPSGAPEAMWGTRSATGVPHNILSGPPLGGRNPQVAFGAAHSVQTAGPGRIAKSALARVLGAE
eukprot:gene17552-biopygen14414